MTKFSDQPTISMYKENVLYLHWTLRDNSWTILDKKNVLTYCVVDAVIAKYFKESLMVLYF